jgi:hypothetical protein
MYKRTFSTRLLILNRYFKMYNRTFARQRVKSLLCLASAPLSSSNFSWRIFSVGSKLCLLCLDKIQSIKWKCVECNKFICDRCKDIHLKVQTNIQHQIIDIKSLFQNVQPKIITDNIPWELENAIIIELNCVY